jgi:phage gp36-like protein
MVVRYGRNEINGLKLDDSKGAGSVEAALTDAAAEIDGYLSQRYRLPLPGNSAFPLLAWASCDIARYRLWEEKVKDDTDTVYVRYRRIVKVLEDIAAGRIALLDAQGLEPEASGKSGPACVIVRHPRVFTNGILDMMDYGDSHSIFTK